MQTVYREIFIIFRMKPCISQPYDCLPGRPGLTAHRPMGPAARAERGSFLNHYEGKCGFCEIHISDKETGGIFLFIEKGPGLCSTQEGHLRALPFLKIRA